MKPLWEGAISFGLILIPVRLYKATDERKPDFHLVREKDLCPITYMRVCRATGEEVPFNEIAKSYQYRKGDQIILHDEDFRQAFQKRSENIEIVAFTDMAAVDTKYYEQPYYVEPQKGAAKVYSLLREALKRTQKAGVAKYVFHNLQHLGILKAEGDMLILNQIRFDSELRKPEGLNIPPKTELAEKEIEIAIMLIDQLSSPFRPEDFRDTYKEEIGRMIDEKIKTGKISTAAMPDTAKPAEIIDLFEKLKLSLEEARKKNAS